MDRMTEIGKASESASDAGENLTPMMRQFRDQKARHPDAILLFRMGDFYEMFFSDAEKASRILDIALTSRDKNKDEGVPMCGFPHHAAPAYISRLLAAGERVAVCDQMEDPRKAKGIVKRQVTRVLTPGLAEDMSASSAEENHFTAAVSSVGKAVGVCVFDLNTGELLATETADMQLASQELRRLDPKEVIVPANLPEGHDARKVAQGDFYLHEVEDWMADAESCVEAIEEQYHTSGIEGFGLVPGSPAAIAVGTLLNYLRKTRMEAPTHVRPPRLYSLGAYMTLDQTALKNLEIFKNLKDGTPKGTLIGLLDRTETPMGARMLRQWLAYPLLDPSEIGKRAETVAELVERNSLRGEIRRLLKGLGDIERIAGRISLKSAGPRDLVHLRRSVERLPQLIAALGDLRAELAEAVRGMDDLSYVAHAVKAVLVDSPPPSVKDGGAIREGYDDELDELRAVSGAGKEWIARFETVERERTGIPNLRVSFNRVFGYYIEVTKSHQEKVPAHYVRKQTLVNAERYITDELKEYELKTLNAQERIQELEEKIFARLRAKLVEVIPRIQETARQIALLDVLTSLADVAAARGYVRPEVHDGDEIRIVEGRHPVVETFNFSETYVPNDVRIGGPYERVMIITGPNMAGKSTFMRQTALIVLMAQMGGFVPAKEASVGIVDRVFTRIGAADYLAFGQSTFMVEMNETADILHNSTPRSLAILDEIGRGTGTFDGLSIAWAVVEYLCDRPGGAPRTLFATHYHELVDLARVRDAVKVYNVQVREWEDRIVFVRKVAPGGAGRSYGIQVAKLAGIPQEVILRAKEVLSNLEGEEIDSKGFPKLGRRRRRSAAKKTEVAQANLFSSNSDELLRELQKSDIESMTPLDALNLLAAWKKRFQE
jgi:DNA mismatch repair protein MutS